jgi:hypothetical protein
MRRFLLLFTVALVMLGSWMPVSAAEPDGEGQVVRVDVATPEALAMLATRLDIWEVHHDEGYLLAYVSPRDAAWLAAQGFAYEEVPSLSAHPATIPGHPCYRTIDEIYAQLDQWASQYPGITQLSVIGSSYEARALKMLRLTNEATGTDKPVFFLMANIHGRELITNEAALVFVERVLERYGTDPDVTWLLDHHLIYVLVSANPDGHIKNEPGEPWAYWRKNTHPYGSCGASDYGVDLNRNYTFKWGGAGTNPCSETYQGPSPASESETQAVQTFVRSVFPDQRGPGDGDPAPDDATGVLITLHSYSNLVLWPWGHTYSSAPNGSQLAALGRKLATFNNYTPQQASQLYPTTGSTDDWSYGELGIASFTFEIGSSGDGFYPSCSRYDALVDPNVDAFFYAAKVARTPYITAFGPDALDVTVTPDSGLAGQILTVAATVDDTGNGQKTIAGAEVYIDAPPWDNGTPYPLTAQDGAFDETVEAVEGQVPTLGLKGGRHLVYVRGRDAEGYWGPVSAAFVDLRDDSALQGTVTDAATAAPLADVLIEVTGDSYAYSMTTQADGHYFVPLPAGTYNVTASLFRYDQQRATITAQTGTTTTQDFALERLPWGTLALEVYELGTAHPLTAEVHLSDVPLTFPAHPTATLEVPVGTYTVTASAAGHADRWHTLSVEADDHITHTFRLPPPPPLLFVDDDDGMAYETTTLAALDIIGIPYDRWTVADQGNVPFTELARYEGVTWLTGDDRRNSLDVSEQAALRNYLEAGGGLILSGQNIGADIHGDPGYFYRDMLHAQFEQDDAGDYLMVEGGGLYAGLDAPLWGVGSANNQDSPDIVAPYDVAATPVFTYSVGGTAGLAVDSGTYRAIYLGFGLEGVNAAPLREAILRESLAWLGVEHPPARYAAALTLSPGSLHRNMAATYTLTLLNDSLMPVSEGDLAVTLAAPLSVLTATPPASVQGDVLRWEDVRLPSEAAATYAWTVWVPDTVTAGSRLTCTVEADRAHMTAPQVTQTATEVDAAYGVELDPITQTLQGKPSESVAHVLTVRNTSDAPMTFTVEQSASRWPTTVDPLSMTLAMRAAAPLTATVTIPPEEDTLLLYAPDVVTLTVTALSDPAVTASAVLRTALTDVTAIYLPVVLRTR